MYKTILVPLNGSDDAEAAVPHAGSVQTAIAVDEAHKDLAVAYLEALRQPKGQPDWVVEVTDGDPSDVIVRRAEELDASIIVMASEGHSRIARSLLGSVSSDVVNRSKRPVLVVHTGDD